MMAMAQPITPSAAEAAAQLSVPLITPEGPTIETCQQTEMARR